MRGQEEDEHVKVTHLPHVPNCDPHHFSPLWLQSPLEQSGILKGPLHTTVRTDLLKCNPDQDALLGKHFPQDEVQLPGTQLQCYFWAGPCEPHQSCSCHSPCTAGLVTQCDLCSCDLWSVFLSHLMSFHIFLPFRILCLDLKFPSFLGPHSLSIEHNLISLEVNISFRKFLNPPGLDWMPVITLIISLIIILQYHLL